MQVLHGLQGYGAVSVYGVTENCHNCRLPWLCTLESGQATGSGDASLCANTTVSTTLNTAYDYMLLDVRHYFIVELRNSGGDSIYKETLTLKEHSTHTLFVGSDVNGNVTVTLVQDEAGDNIYVPLGIAVGVVVGVAVLYGITVCIWSARSRSDDDSDSQYGASSKAGGNIQVCCVVLYAEHAAWFIWLG